MFRALFLVAGVAAIALAIWSRNGDPAFIRTPVDAEVAQLLEMLETRALGDRQAVNARLVLEAEGTRHPTALWLPGWSRCLAEEVLALEDASHDASGCRIRVDAAASGVPIQLPEKTTLRTRVPGVIVYGDVIVGGRLLAPLTGHGCSLWALSPYFKDDDRAEREAWTRRASHMGLSTRLEDLRTNLPDLAENPPAEAIRAACVGEPEGARVLIEGGPVETVTRNLRATHLPVRGGEGRVFLATRGVAPITVPSPILAVFEIAPAAEYAGLWPDDPPAARVGTLTRTSQAALSRSPAAGSWMLGGFGVVLVATAGMLHLLNEALRRAKRRRHEHLTQGRAER